VTARLRAALDETAASHGPGLFGLVTEPGQVVFEGAAGVADLAQPRPMTADDQVKIGSITKTYVSVLLLQLLRDGAFARTDTVERWLPGLVAGGDELTVDLLLRMRSGLPDYVRTAGRRRLARLGLVRYERPDGTVAFGHHGGVPGYHREHCPLWTCPGRTVPRAGCDLPPDPEPEIPELVDTAAKSRR
jgi:CubicO group peptidase (beta-lactamase class C family)